MSKKTNPTNDYLYFNPFKTFGFGILNQETDLKIVKGLKRNLTHNMVLDFVISAYNYAKMVFNDYTSIYSKKKIYTTYLQ